MPLNRRSLLKCAAAIPLATVPDGFVQSAENQANSETADYAIRIATGLVELSSESIVSTTLYNGQFPGPLLRLTEGKRVVVDIYNDTDTPEQLHWHGQFVPVDVDGAAEEGTPYIPAHGTRRPLCRSHRAFASTTAMSFRKTISVSGPTAAKPVRSISNRPTIREPTIAKSSSCSRSSCPRSARAATWRWIFLREIQSKNCRASAKAPMNSSPDRGL